MWVETGRYFSIFSRERSSFFSRRLRALRQLPSLSAARCPTVIFFSSREELSQRIAEEISVKLKPSVCLGCTTPGGVLADGVEVEADEPVVAIIAASLPRVVLIPFFTDTGALPSLVSAEGGDSEKERLSLEPEGDLWSSIVALPESEAPSVILLTSEENREFSLGQELHPNKFSIDQFLKHLDFAIPSSPKIGGILPQQSTTALYLNGEKQGSAGALGVFLLGDIAMDPIVAQGCNPLGAPMTISKAQGNVIFGLNGQPLRTALAKWLHDLDAEDRLRFTSVVLVGLKLEEEERTAGKVKTITRDNPPNPEYVIRHAALLQDPLVQGTPAASLVVAIPSDYLREGQTIQFHYRTSLSSSNEFQQIMETLRTRERSAAAAAEDQSQEESQAAAEEPVSSSAVLMFPCVGRGKNFYGLPNHESEILRKTLGNIPIAGTFCSGEIGSLGRRTFIHGYTTSLAMFRPRRRAKQSPPSERKS